VIGAGFGRTGTMSTKAALEILGYKTYHMREAMGQGHLRGWAWALEQKRAGGGGEVPPAHWASLLSSYTATTDFPACLFYRELLARNPGAKVILTIRGSPEEWVRSFRTTIGSLEYSPFHRFFTHLGTYVFPSLLWYEQALDLTWEEAFYRHDPSLRRARLSLQDDASLARIYEGWIQEVRETVPADRLLVFNVREGWEPLCRFLGKEIPQEKFPNMNDQKEIQGFFRFHFYLGLALAASPFLLLPPLFFFLKGGLSWFSEGKVL